MSELQENQPEITENGFDEVNEAISANDDEEPVISLASRREKRQKLDKTGRSAALQRLRDAKLRGEKHKADISETCEPVYEEVDEAKYSELVRERQEDDWIVDDGSGYVEDGREIFDEEEELSRDRRKKGKSDKFRSDNPNVRDSKAKSSLKNYFTTAPKKKESEKPNSVADDNILDEFLGALHAKTTPKLRDLNEPRNPPQAQPPKPQSERNPFARNRVPQKREPSSPLEPDSPIKPKHTKIARNSISDVKKRGLGFLESENDVNASTEGKSSAEDAKIDTKNCLESSTLAEENLDYLGDIDFDDHSENLHAGNGGESGEIRAKEEATALESSAVVNRGFKEAPVEDSSKKSAKLGWFSGSFDTTVSETKSSDSDQRPIMATEEDGEMLKFYWLDAYEDTFKNPGTVYLFGRVWVKDTKCFTSCCVTVKNVEKILYFLPKASEEDGEELEFAEVYEEVQKALFRLGIGDFRLKKTTKKYAFDEKNVPVEADYLEVHYNATKYKQSVPSDLSGKGFSRVFGTTSSCLEVVLLEKNLRGPAWLEIKNYSVVNPKVTWCNWEVAIEGISNVDIVSDCSSVKLPTVCTATLNFVTATTGKNKQQQIVAVSLLVNKKYELDKPPKNPPFEETYCYICKPSDTILPFDFRDQIKSKNLKYVEIVGNERALLNLLLLRLQKCDPDILICHDMLAYNLDLLIHRLSANKVPNWSRIGRLRRSAMPPKASASKSAHADALAGRIGLDTKVAAKELIRCRSYDLTELTQRLLDSERSEMLPEEIAESYNESKSLIEMIMWMMNDAFYTLKIACELNCLPLFLQITQIVGGVMSRTLMGGRSERNEYLLLHAFHDKGYLTPDKNFSKKRIAEAVALASQEGDEEATQPQEKDGKKKNSYAGGLVLEPKKGLYDCYILLLDFNSLYPSIIQEFNICFTTVDRSSKNESLPDSDIPNVPPPNLDPGILPTEIRKLVESRREVKKLMKSPNLSSELAMQYNIRQMALKLTANSMYGCLGFGNSRFYAKPLAALITAKGREILMHTKELVEKMNLDVIYGDTDSIMINSNSTNLEEVMNLGKKVKAEVNKLYRLLELDIDGVYKSLLLLKKKKYAGIAVEQLLDGQTKLRRELKGLDIVRRDWSDLAKDAGNFVIDEILSDKQREGILDNIHQYLIDLGEKIKNGDISLNKFEISKALTKAPADYPDKKCQPHVSVALRMNGKGKAHYKQGDTVSYIICLDGTNNPATQRAYNVLELKEDNKLTIDSQYYLTQQVHPVVSRLCEPIEGTDSARIAECLGLDATSYRQRMAATGGGGEDWELTGPSLDFSQCTPFTFFCLKPDCGAKIEVRKPFIGQGVTIDYSLGKCSNEKCSCSPIASVPVLVNNLQLAIRSAISRYYAGWMVCEDATCGLRTRRVPVRMSREGTPICPACQQSTLHQECTEKDLFTQLSFFNKIFDYSGALAGCSEMEKSRLMRNRTPEIKSGYEELHKVITGVINRNAYSEVNLEKLFQSIMGC